MGRALAASTFHHFADYNWDLDCGAPTFVTEPQGTEIKADPSRLAIFKDYVRNIATWLHPRHGAADSMTTPAAASIGLTIDVKSDSGPSDGQRALPHLSDGVGHRSGQSEGLGLIEVQPNVLDHQAGRESVVERARQHRPRELVAARVGATRSGVEHIDHTSGRPDRP